MNAFGTGETGENAPASAAPRFWDDYSPQEAFLGHELLKELPSWIGGDICAVGDSTILPGEAKILKVLLKREHFPAVSPGKIFQWWVKRLSYSTRSCFAQSGVFVEDTWPYYVRNSLLHEIETVGEGVLEIPIKNVGYTRIRISDGVGMLRFFHLSPRDKVRRSNLYSLVRNGGFSIVGTYGETWFLVDSHGNRLLEADHSRAENLVLVLNESQYKSEAADGVEPIVMRSKKDLVKVLNPLEEGENRHFVIGETPAVSLGKGVYGKIFTLPYSHDDPFPWKVTDSRHEPSPLIDEGFSGPIRTEISGGNRFIEMEIYGVM